MTAIAVPLTLSAVHCWAARISGQRVQDGVPFELYNLREDIGETRNLAAEYPEKVAELARLLGERLRGWNAPMPIVRATGKPVPWPDELLK